MQQLLLLRTWRLQRQRKDVMCSDLHACVIAAARTTSSHKHVCMFSLGGLRVADALAAVYTAPASSVIRTMQTDVKAIACYTLARSDGYTDFCVSCC
jgi:hypothetical protein